MPFRDPRSIAIHAIALANAMLALTLAWSGAMHAALLPAFAAAAAQSAASDPGFLDLSPARVFALKPLSGDSEAPAHSVAWLLLSLMFLIAWLLAGTDTLSAR